jgi:hypothetical protein
MQSISVRLPMCNELCLPDRVGFRIFTFDRTAALCEAMLMSHPAEKFIAVILAIWLPLFSGNALAASIAMQAMVGEHHAAVAQPGEPPQHCALTVQQNTHPAQLDVNLDQSADHSSQQNPDQQNSAGENCGTCHFACCGYLAAATVEVTKVKPLAWLFASLSTQFQSITLIPLDPPPLARV